MNYAFVIPIWHTFKKPTPGEGNWFDVPGHGVTSYDALVSYPEHK